MGLDQTNNFIKMGDGTTAWNSLAQFTQNIENVEDLVGAMVTSNTETFITVTYDDSDGTLDFVVPVLDEDAMGSNSATNLATQQSIKAYVDAQTHLTLLDEDNMGSNSATQAASQQSIKAYVDAQDTASDLDFQGDSGGALSIDLDSETLDIAGGTNITTAGSGNTITVNIAPLDEDNMATNSATQVASQQSIKAYVDAQDALQDNTDEITEGSTNLFYTNARARASISVTDAGGDGSLAYNSTSGVITYTGSSAAEARAHISVTDAGGDGSCAYNSSTGVITYTGPSAAEVRAHLSAGTGVGYSSGAISIGQAVATDSDVTFADLTLSGDLTVNGTTSTVASTNTTHTDALIEFGNGTTGTPANDAGIVIERGDQNNAFIGYDESADEFTMGTGTFTGASTGNLTITAGTLNIGAVKATSMALTGAVTTNSTFDGRDVATDGAKLDLIEASATADQTGAQIKAAYEAETSAFTDAQFTKLAAIEALADVTDATNVNAAGALMLSDTTTAGLGIVIDEDAMGSASATKVPTQQSVKAYVDAREAAITTAYAAADDTQDHLSELDGTMDNIANGTTYVKTHNDFTDAFSTKMGGIEALADVTDATNVEAAGAVMESGDTASAKIPSGTTAQRDGSPSAGYFRWNTTTGGAEIYDGSAWGLVGGGNTTGKMMWEHSYTVTADYEITSGNNAITAGPIIINSGYSVTTPSGCNWVII
jgi:hypothetical protein